MFQDKKSFVDLGDIFGREPEKMFISARRRLGDDLTALTKQNKRASCPWSEAEVKYLVSRRKEGATLKELRKMLRRTEPAIEQKLQTIAGDAFKSNRTQGPQVIPSEIWQRFFHERLMKIGCGLLMSDMTALWRAALEQRPFEEWAQLIATGIPEQVQQILGGIDPPTFEKLTDLPQVDTTDAGVYARLMRTKDRPQLPCDRYLYVGSAAKYNFGLNDRVRRHIVGDHGIYRISTAIKKRRLEEPGHFIALMTIKANSPGIEDVVHSRRVAVLAEAILTVWLGALRNPRWDLKSLYPWDIELLDYRPWCSHNPLTLDIEDIDTPSSNRTVESSNSNELEAERNTTGNADRRTDSNGKLEG
ncbi:hypothetical protein TWF281_000446 [Arthrobotrys megalospora]